MSNTSQGYRGYIGSRAYHGVDFPQNVQNKLIRSYCERYNLTYLLSATEYTMPGCYMILEEVVKNIELVDGVVMFSVFMLPEKKERRERIYEAVLSKKRTLHAALEDITIQSEKDIQRVEDILMLNKIALTSQAAESLKDFLVA